MTAHGEATFQVLVPDLASAPDVLGIWSSVPDVAGRPEGDLDEEVSLWQATLPEDRLAASAALAERTGSLLSAQQAVPWAASRLEAYTQRAQAASRPGTASYAPAQVRMARPEQELDAWLLAEQGVAEYGRLDDVRAGIERAVRELSVFGQQLRRTLTRFAYVETTSGGRTLGRTSVEWLGDVDTLWGVDLSPAEAALHQRTLALALASRQAWMRLALVVGAGAVRLSAVLASPLVVPAAFKFVIQVMDEVREVIFVERDATP
jgi:hypothetical protein